MISTALLAICIGSVNADYEVLAELSRRLSSGDILNVCVNAIHAGSVDADPAKWRVTQAIMEREIAKAKKAKAEHSGEKDSYNDLRFLERAGADRQFQNHRRPAAGGAFPDCGHRWFPIRLTIEGP